MRAGGPRVAAAGAAVQGVCVLIIGYAVKESSENEEYDSCWCGRKTSAYPPGGHGAALALLVCFGGAGIASLTTATIFGYLAISRGEIFLWMFHPITIFVVQGTVWYIAFAIRRRIWLGIVSAGWHLSAVAMAVLLNKGLVAPLLLLLGFGLLLLMALPGWVLWRSARG